MQMQHRCLGAETKAPSVPQQATSRALRRPTQPWCPHTHQLVPSTCTTVRSTAHRSLIVATAAAAPPAATAPPERPPEVVIPVEGVKVLEVTKNVKCLRGVCNERLKYEIEYALKRGSTDNAYLLTVPDTQNYVLIDVPFKAYADAFVDVLSKEIDLHRLSHVVITHVGPNRIATLAPVLQKALKGRPQGRPLTLVVTNPAAKVLESGLQGDNADLLQQVRLEVVKREEPITISDAMTLNPILTPTPRWPDLMCVYDPASKVLFSSKLFSAQVSPHLMGNDKASESAFDVGGWGTYGDDWRYFFECMLAPVPKQTQAALEKLPISATPRVAKENPKAFVSSLLKLWNAAVFELTRGAKDAKAPAEIFAYALAPQHGPVVRTALGQLVFQYRRWAEAQVAALATSNVAVLYASAYGNTAAIAQAISRGITKGGVAVQTLNLEVASMSEVEETLKQSNGFAIGSPTLGGHMPTQVQVALGSILRQANAKELPCGVFGSFGWSGEAVDEMEAKLKDAGFGFAFNSIRVKFKPTAKDLMTCEQSGRDLAVQVKRKLKAKERGATATAQTTTASGSQLAMGRVVGSLCVVTARDEDATSAMLASWISQASFDPPGLTVAVKKDRGMEMMLSVGSKFAMSILPEGKDKLVLKALARPFAPGADRLADLETKDSEVSGCPILNVANAYLDCEVMSRMEAGDHWVVYGRVLDGKVLADGALTAVHHRKVGNHY